MQVPFVRRTTSMHIVRRYRVVTANATLVVVATRPATSHLLLASIPMHILPATIIHTLSDEHHATVLAVVLPSATTAHRELIGAILRMGSTIICKSVLRPFRHLLLADAAMPIPAIGAASVPAVEAVGGAASAQMLVTLVSLHSVPLLFLAMVHTTTTSAVLLLHIVTVLLGSLAATVGLLHRIMILPLRCCTSMHRFVLVLLLVVVRLVSAAVLIHATVRAAFGAATKPSSITLALPRHRPTIIITPRLIVVVIAHYRFLTPLIVKSFIL